MSKRIKLTITTSLVIVAIIIGTTIGHMSSQGYAQNTISNNTTSSSSGNNTAANTNTTSPSANSTSGSNITK